ncbi:MAG TPA: NYN domain-containing protein [Methanothrix sp.]|nr:NYN domain-containing protein [Methanothrix sp.]HQE97699.1 NYN domain-containing protein [Methanothrix sp.]HQJ80811.1 NYN domain-containing protein [Methanothrix sp.]
MSDRAAVFIDGAYLTKILDVDFGKPKIDLARFSDILCGDYERLRTYYYNCMPYQSNPPTEDERRRFASMDKFVYTLRKLPRFEVKLGRLGCVGGEFIQKRVDIALAADLVRLSCGRMIQKAVLVTGDSDFLPAIEAAKEAGVLVTLYYSQSSIHDELLSAVDESEMMDQELISQVAR